MEKAVEYLRLNAPFNEELIKNIAPLGWEHINFLGEYTFDMKNIANSDKLRPLNIIPKKGY